MYTGLQKFLPNYSINVLKSIIRKFASTTLNETENVIYPPILDLSVKGRAKRKREEWNDKIKKLETVEEKLFGINMPRYYGWRSLYLTEGKVAYNSLDHAQYITHTHVMNKLPEFYDSVITTEQLDAVVQTVKHQIESAIAFEYCHRLNKQEITEEVERIREKMLQDAITNALVYQINRILLATLSSTTPHLLEAEVDFAPRVEAFWFAGGIEPPSIVKRAKANSKFYKGYANNPVNMPVQYVGSPILQLRHQLPLKKIISIAESTNAEFNIPQYRFYPTVLGHSFSHRHATSIPGFWPGDPAEFGLLSYHNLNNIFFNSVPLDEEAIIVQAIFASYSWLLSQACYQGFSTVNDITYPLLTQTVLTNGQLWSFCVYQLNTTLLYSEHADENPKRNICWITKPVKLFDKVEDGKVYGFNEDVLKRLLTFYTNTPVERSNENMKPYLGESVKYIADIADPERRIWLESQFKHLMSNRPRHLKVPEIYNWQKIYMINHKTRSLDKKRDPWQFGFSPSKRRLDDHAPEYIPKCLRENPKLKKVGRWRKTYYPDA